MWPVEQVAWWRAETQDMAAPVDKVCGHTCCVTALQLILSYTVAVQAYSAYTIYLLLGTAVLFPWNAFITAADYFEFEFPVLLAALALANAVS